MVSLPGWQELVVLLPHAGPLDPEQQPLPLLLLLGDLLDLLLFSWFFSPAVAAAFILLASRLQAAFLLPRAGTS